jgi:hypothetical protein
MTWLKLTLDIAKNIAIEKNGTCVSSVYLNANSPLDWKCEKGHTFKASLHEVKNKNSWCKDCYNLRRGISQRSNISEMNYLARKHNGVCLSKEYVNSQSFLEWKCSKGHIFKMRPSNVIQGQWCNDCFNEKRGSYTRLGIDEIRKRLSERGEILLSDNYLNNKTHLEVKCANGHNYITNAQNIVSGRRCPTCSNQFYRSEEICRAIFEKIFNNKFPKYRPNWLKNSRNNQMELDGYCSDLKLAFEYQGQQHFKKVNKFNKNLNSRKEDDLKKKNLCILNNVTLIEIPYTVKQKDLPAFIISECQTNKININSNLDTCLYDIKGIYSKKLEEMKDYAESKGGTCLAESYISTHFPVKWKCAKGHEWEAAFSNVKYNTSWCPTCADKKKHTIEDMRAIAENYGGKCISNNYVNNKTKLNWKCKLGHDFSKAPSDIIHKKQWCPTCTKMNE